MLGQIGLTTVRKLHLCLTLSSVLIGSRLKQNIELNSSAFTAKFMARGKKM